MHPHTCSMLQPSLVLQHPASLLGWHSIPPMVEHLLNNPSNSALGFGLTLGLLMSGYGFPIVKQELNSREGKP